MVSRKKRDEKIQNYMFRALLKHPEQTFYFNYNEYFVAVTWNGFQVYILDKYNLYFNINQCGKYRLPNEFDPYILTRADNDEELTLTAELIQVDKKFIQRLKAKNFEVLVKADYIKDFGEARYYSRNSKDRVLITELESERVIGCVMPVNPNI